MSQKAKWQYFTKEELFNIAKQSFNRKDFFLKMGYTAYCSKTMLNILKYYPELDKLTPYRNCSTKKWKNFSEEQLLAFAEETSTRVDFMKKLGYTSCRPDIYKEIIEYFPSLKNKIKSHTDSFWKQFTKEEIFAFAKEAKNQTDFCKKLGYTERGTNIIANIQQQYPDLIIPKEDNQCKLKNFSKEELQKIANESIGYEDFYNKIGYISFEGKGNIVRKIKEIYPDFIFPRFKYCSYGESKIKRILNKLKYNFNEQYYFNDLRGKRKRPLRFDFAIFIKDKIILIEYQGEQHYEEIPHFKSSLQEVQERDNMKKQYCKDKGYYLIEIPYWDFKKIDENYIKERILCLL